MDRASRAESLHETTTSAPGLLFEGAAVAEDGAPLFAETCFEAPAGRWTALLGRSGVGKTSILKTIAGLIRPPRFEGSVETSDGAPIAGRVAWMAQDGALPPWLTALDSVQFGSRLRREPLDPERARRALAAVGLADKAVRLPDQLSGGERQRVALARALYEDRPLALLDEPFSALDALTRESLQALAREKLAGRTVILVTHDPLEAARLADRAYAIGPSGAVRACLEESAAPVATLRAPEDPETAERARQLRAALETAA